MEKYFPLPLPLILYPQIIDLLDEYYQRIHELGEDFGVSEESIVHCSKNLKIALFGYKKNGSKCDLNDDDYDVLECLYIIKYKELKELFKGKPHIMQSLAQDLDRMSVAIAVIGRYIDLCSDDREHDDYY
jgi:hypothetical protein